MYNCIIMFVFINYIQIPVKSSIGLSLTSVCNNEVASLRSSYDFHDKKKPQLNLNRSHVLLNFVIT